jgi:hypothetical protein
MRNGERHGRRASSEISDGQEPRTSEQLHPTSSIGTLYLDIHIEGLEFMGRKAHVNLVIPRLGFFKLDA